MPINIIANTLRVKDDNGQYISIDAITDDTTENRIAAIEAEADIQIERLNTRGNELKNIIIAPTRISPSSDLGIIIEAGTTSATTEVIEDKVDEYLQTAIPPNYQIDDDLDTAGAAADAKATGDEIASLKTRTTTIENKFTNGILKTELSQAVQASLNKADTALQSTSYPVTSVNSKTGAVVLTASDINGVGTYTAPVGGIPYEDLDANLRARIDSDTITSVNTKTGAVVLTAEDIKLSSNSNVTIASAINSSENLSSKADKVTGTFSENNFVALDANGNIKDSGHNHADYLTSHQDISGKMDKLNSSNFTAGHFLTTDSSGNIVDSNYDSTSFSGGSGTAPDVSGKADKVTGATNNNFAALDSNGNLKDSGHKHGDYQPAIGNVSGLLKGDGSGGISAATSGTDYYVKPSGGIPSTDLASNVIPTVHNVPSGGTAGQVLSKTNATDYAVQWSTPYTGTVTETVTGSTPTITGVNNHRYVCGTCSTLEIVVPSSGIIDVLFQSGSTATVLTITPQSNQTIYWPSNFDPTSLSADTTYELNILDNYGVVAIWS